MLLLTIFLRHDQSQTLDEIQARLKQTGFYESFPPQGVEVVSWHVVMGIGQVVTLKLPADKLRDVNRMIEVESLGRLPHRVLSDLRFQAGLGDAAPAGLRR